MAPDRQAMLFILASAKDFVQREEEDFARLERILDETRTALDVKGDRIIVGKKVIAECEAELHGQRQQAAE